MAAMETPEAKIATKNKASPLPLMERPWISAVPVLDKTRKIDLEFAADDEEIGLGIVRPPRNPPLFGGPKPFATYSWPVVPD